MMDNLKSTELRPVIRPSQRMHCECRLRAPPATMYTEDHHAHAVQQRGNLLREFRRHLWSELSCAKALAGHHGVYGEAVPGARQVIRRPMRSHRGPARGQRFIRPASRGTDSADPSGIANTDSDATSCINTFHVIDCACLRRSDATNEAPL